MSKGYWRNFENYLSPKTMEASGHERRPPLIKVQKSNPKLSRKSRWFLRGFTVIHLLALIGFCLYFFRDYLFPDASISFVDTKIYFPGLLTENEILSENYFQYDYQFDYLVENERVIESNQDTWRLENPVDLTNNSSGPVSSIVLKFGPECFNKTFKFGVDLLGSYYVMCNIFPAENGNIECNGAVTLATHADFKNLGHLEDLANRWNNPISLALYAPGNDFYPTIESIQYLRNCVPSSKLIRMWVSFHIYYDVGYIPVNSWLRPSVNCSMEAPFKDAAKQHTNQNILTPLYPINVGRNIARREALTYYILETDIDLYPSINLSAHFLELIRRKPVGDTPRVYVLPVFEINDGLELPRTKTELVKLVRSGQAQTFNRTCGSKGFPFSRQWIEAPDNPSLNFFGGGKRLGEYRNWQPFFIETSDVPYHNERLSLEGKSDRAYQAYILCTLNYDFLLLDNAFLMHRKQSKQLRAVDSKELINKTTQYLIMMKPRLARIYGVRDGCRISNENLCL